MTSVDEARKSLGGRLRELRKQAGLNGKQLAESLSWTPSKISKLEIGRQAPTDDDIRSWTRATNSESETEILLTALYALEIQHAEWKRLIKTGLRSHQKELIEQDEKTKLYRVFEPVIIPGLLQAPEYARSRFSQAITVRVIQPTA